MFYTADAHCDFLYYATNGTFSIDSDSFNQAISLSKLKEGGVALQFFAAWYDKELRTAPMQQCINMIKSYKSMLKKFPNEFVEFSSEFVPGNGKIATVLTMEGAEPLCNDVSNVDIFAMMGVRAMTLTWNYANALAHPATAKRNIGLTALGKKVIRRMNENSIAVDVSHLSDAGIDDVLELSSTPPFASHSNSRSVYPSKRSLCDEHIVEIARRGGVVGVNFYYPQLCERSSANVHDIIKHIEHIAEVGGISSVCIGSDFDGMTVYPEDVSHSGKLPLISDELARLGYSDSDIAQIMYYNLRNYIAKFC